MAFKATRYFVVIVVLVLGGTRYMNSNRKRINLNDDVGVWDSKAKDGLRLTVLTRSNETGGEYFVVNSYCTTKAQGFYPGKPGSPPIHVHTTQVEEFKTLSGMLSLALDGKVVQLPPGDTVAVPPGVPHTFWNAGPEPVEFTVRFTPGVPSENFLETLDGLSLQFGGLNKVNPIQLFLLFAESNITLADIPPPLWKAARTVLVPLAKIMGFRSHYPEYTTKAGQPLPVNPPAAAAPAPVAEAAAPVEAPVAEAAAPVEAPVAEAAAPVEEPVAEAAAPVEEPVAEAAPALVGGDEAAEL